MLDSNSTANAHATADAHATAYLHSTADLKGERMRGDLYERKLQAEEISLLHCYSSDIPLKKTGKFTFPPIPGSDASNPWGLWSIVIATTPPFFRHGSFVTLWPLI